MQSPIGTDGARRSSRWNPTRAQVAAGRGDRRRLADVHLGGRRRGQVAVAHPGEHLGHGHVGREDQRLRGHQAAGRGLVVAEQAAQVGRLHRLHRREQPFSLLGGHLAEQVGGVVRLHLLDHVGRALDLEAVEQPDLVLLGHLLEQVGQLVVVERGRELAPPGLGQRLDGGGQVGRRHLAQAGELLGERAGLEQLAAFLPRHDVRAVAEQAPAPAEGEGGHLPAVAGRPRAGRWPRRRPCRPGCAGRRGTRRGSRRSAG